MYRSIEGRVAYKGLLKEVVYHIQEACVPVWVIAVQKILRGYSKQHLSKSPMQV